MLLQEARPWEVQRLFAEIAQRRPDAVIVSAAPEFLSYRQLIVELAENTGCRRCTLTGTTWRQAD
jgi:hypothetical protein